MAGCEGVAAEAPPASMLVYSGPTPGGCAAPLPPAGGVGAAGGKPRLLMVRMSFCWVGEGRGGGRSEVRAAAVPALCSPQAQAVAKRRRLAGRQDRSTPSAHIQSVDAALRAVLWAQVERAALRHLAARPRVPAGCVHSRGLLVLAVQRDARLRGRGRLENWTPRAEPSFAGERTRGRRRRTPAQQLL